MRPIFAVLCMLAAAVQAQEPAALRSTVRIAAGWRFQLDVTDIGEKEHWYATGTSRSAWKQAPVPKAWDLYDEALWGYEGIGWYSVVLDAGLARKNRVQRLKFGRVNYDAKVWLNGELLGENVNGYLPFEFDVSGKLRGDAASQLVLRVDNRARLNWLPAARQIEWIHYGGILAPVELETTARTYISDVTIDAVPQGSGAAIQCKVEVTSREPAEADAVLRVAVAGHPRSSKSVPLAIAPGATAVSEVTLALERADAWSPDHPALYTLVATLESGKPVDRVASRFGVRKIETRGREILLNGTRFGARGVNRYDEYGRYGPNPPRALLVEDVRRMKNAGVNFVRVHYPQSPEILSLYDEMGIVMSEEVPLNWWGNNFSGQGDEVQSEAILEQAMPHLERMIRRDKNHPSVIIWSMCNESQTQTEVGIAVMRKLIRRARQLDPTRLKTFVISPQDAAPHKAYQEADLLAINAYQGQFGRDLAVHAADFEELVTRPTEAYIRRQLAAFPDKPVLITEFGTRGVPGIHGDMPYSEDFQAGFIQAAWKAIQNCPEASGGVLWCWADYYHRRNLIHYAVFGPYGVVTVDRRPKAALDALTKMYGGKPVVAAAPRTSGRLPAGQSRR